MPRVDKPDVLVVGAGPTGLALACDLLARGVSVSLVDQREGPSQTSRAIGLQPRALEIMQCLGAAVGLQEEAVRAAGTDIFAGGKRVLELKQAFGDVAPVLIGQNRIEARLRARIHALGGSVSWRYKLEALDIGSDAIAARLQTPAGEELVEPSWVVGCDGAHSVVRRLLGLELRGSTHPETMILADVAMDLDQPRNRLASWVHPEGLLAVAPLPEGRWRLFAEVTPDDPLVDLITRRAEVTPDQIAPKLTELLRSRSEVGGVEIGTIVWSSVFRFHQRIVEDFRVGRCFLAGDAAHIHSAQGAQGMNLGIGDAFNLGWKLAAVVDGAHPRLLDTYSEERRPVAETILRRTGAGWRITLGNSLPARLLRDLIVLPLMRLKSVQHRIALTASQLSISYKGGPLAPLSLYDRLTAGGRAQPGDRAPCARLSAGAGTRDVRLAEVRGSGWTLISFGRPRSGKGDRAVLRGMSELGVRLLCILPPGASPPPSNLEMTLLIDVAGEAERAYQPAYREWLLVRPDGHIAVRARRLSQVEKYLTQVMIHGGVEAAFASASSRNGTAVWTDRTRSQTPETGS